MSFELLLETFNAVANLVTAALIAWVVREQKASSAERSRRMKGEREDSGN